MIVVAVVVTGGKQSQLLALALGLGWSLTKYDVLVAIIVTFTLSCFLH